MDGIDGISGVEAFSIGAGVMLLALPMPGAGPPASLFLGASIPAAAAGFLWWHWHPAKVFLGDFGRVPLGLDRQSVGQGQSASVRVDLGGRRIIKRNSVGI